MSYIAKSATASKAILEHPVHLSNDVEVHVNSHVGRYSFLNIGTVVYSNVSIGRYCSFGRSCEIGLANHPMDFLSTHSFQYSKKLFPDDEAYINRKLLRWDGNSLLRTNIGNDVWIGAQSLVKSGVEIGHGAVVAANSIVTKNVAPYAIVAGSPAKLIRYRFDNAVVARLLKVEWWNLPFEEISKLPFEDLERCLRVLECPAAT